MVAAARAKGIEVSAEAAKLSIPDAVFDSVHNGDCGSRVDNPDALKNQYPDKVLWSEDPAVQRRNRADVAAAIISVQKKLGGVSAPHKSDDTVAAVGQTSPETATPIQKPAR